MSTDRNSQGQRWTAGEIAREFDKQRFNDWRAVTLVATVLAESDGFEWARPIVLKQQVNHPAHLSVDRGICQFNSHYFDKYTDRQCFDAATAIELMANEVRGRDGRWRLDDKRLLLWNAYSSGAYRARLGEARAGVNAVRASRQLDPI